MTRWVTRRDMIARRVAQRTQADMLLRAYESAMVAGDQFAAAKLRLKFITTVKDAT